MEILLLIVFIVGVGLGTWGVLHLMDRLDHLTGEVRALARVPPPPPVPVVSAPAPPPPPPLFGRPPSPATVVCVDRHRRKPCTIRVDRAGYLLRFPGAEYHRVDAEGPYPIYALAAGNHRIAMESQTKVH